ncbi:MAG: pyruvate kinase [Bryobacteraceae bacterium]
MDPEMLRETEALAEELLRLRSQMRNLEAERSLYEDLHPDHCAGARNLLHYMALRRNDIRHLQGRLASMGLSSLGRTESHVMGNLNAVLRILLLLRGAPPIDCEESETRANEGSDALKRNTSALLGERPDSRRVRIMVTMPSEAAHYYELIRDLLDGGMNCMRINCAHDGPEQWLAMINHLRRAESETGKFCKVAMDLAGPKLRTGPMEPGPAVLKCHPKRDELGRVQSGSRIWLTSFANPEPPAERASVVLRVADRWLARLQCGDEIHFLDARRARRSLVVTATKGRSRCAEARQTVYFTPGLVLTAVSASGVTYKTRIHPKAIARRAQAIPLVVGSKIVLTRSLKPGRLAVTDDNGETLTLPRIGVTLPEFFECVRTGEPVWFDDGKIGGIVTVANDKEVAVEITYAQGGRAKLAAEKGINLPESELRLASLTAEDHKALEFIVRHADLVGYSFVRTPADVTALQRRLKELGGEHVGVILKIETQQAFENLPQLLLAAMSFKAFGVMIARGDLAVECGFERLAELQEEILWISEAAHVPVIWATQVLESLIKSGAPSRSEITDAAMGERAECVMLNKGPYLVSGVKALDDILCRMESHQEKKRPMLRRLQVAASFRQ